MRDVFFALPGEEWRIDAYIENIMNRTLDLSNRTALQLTGILVDSMVDRSMPVADR